MSDDVTMRMPPLLRLVLVAAVALLTSASVNAEVILSTDKTASSSSSPSLSKSYRFDTESREQVIAGMEASLMSLMGITKRPKPQGQTYIPESLKTLHARQTSIGIADIAKPGLHTRSANTVRSFSHVGEWICISLIGRKCERQRVKKYFQKQKLKILRC